MESLGTLRRSLRVRLDVTHQLTREISYGSENAACDDFALDAGKPDLDLVEPRRVGRREVELDVRVLVEEGFDLLRLVRRQIVQDNVDFAFRLA